MTSSPEFNQKRRFIISLGKALHKFGTPAYRLEAHLENVSKLLQIQGGFIISPTALTFVLAESKDSQEYTHVARVNPGEIDLGSLARTDELVDELDSGQRTLDEAIERLEEIANKPNPYSKLLTFLAFGASSGAFAMLMHTTWSDVLWSTILGFIVALYVFWSERSKRVLEMLEPVSALTSALIISGVAVFDPTINVSLVILSAIIPFIPGLLLR